MSNPVQYELLKQRFPELASALERNDAGNFSFFFSLSHSLFSIDFISRLDSAKVRQLMEQLSSGEQAQFESDYSFSSNDLCDAEAQQRIAENIRLQNIQQNMESALEYMPEAFGNVVMLYIDCQVNGHHVKAFVDSGSFFKCLLFFLKKIFKSSSFFLITQRRSNDNNECCVRRKMRHHETSGHEMGWNC